MVRNYQPLAISYKLSGNKMKKDIIWANCEFKIGAMDIEAIPATHLNEIAFAGRSNVGKSSLVNAITGRNSLVRVSKTPGCTRQLNFFELSEQIYLVDMPGYGFAQRAKKEKYGWGRLITEYLTGRVRLRRIFLLIDSRHGLKEGDIEIMKLLDKKAVTYQIVLTKIDELKEAELQKVIEETTLKIKKHPAAFPEIIVTSSERKLGIDVIRKEILGLI